MRLLSYLGPAWLFLGTFLIINAWVLVYVPLADVTGFATEPVPSEGLSLGICDTTQRYTVNETSATCFSAGGDAQQTLSCDQHGENELLLSLDKETGEVACKPNPDRADELASDARIRALVDYALIWFSGLAFATGSATVVIGGKGLMKMKAWAYRASILLSAVMIIGAVGVLTITTVMLLPEISNSPDERLKQVSNDLVGGFVSMFGIQLIAGGASLLVLLKSRPASRLTV